MNGEYAKEMLASLGGLDTEELKRRYSELFGSGIDASRFGRAFLRRRIAAKLQEAVYGGCKGHNRLTRQRARLVGNQMRKDT